MASQISVGALSAIFDESKPEVSEPIFQCLQIKPIVIRNQERYQTVFSDSSNFVQTVLATQINHFGSDGIIRRGCFVKLKNFQANFVKGKHLLVILDLDVLSELGECERVGEPKQLKAKSTDDDASRSAIPSGGFYGARPQNQPQRAQHTNTSALAAPANIYPIEGLSQFSDKWTIKARCTNKSSIKKWNNAHGEGKLFSVNLVDDSGEIRATAFKDQCDLFYGVFEEGSVYYISNCKVQIAKKQFSNINNDYELTFERDTVVEKAQDQTDVPQIRFNFTSIGDLQSVDKGTTIDVLGVLKDVEATTQIVSKTTHKSHDKRDLTLVDNSGFSVRLTVWANTATSFDALPESVIAFKGVKVSDFGGRTLSLLSSGWMTVDPDIEEAHRLKGWYDAQGKSHNFTSFISGSSTGGSWPNFKTIAEIKNEELGMTDQANFALKATVIHIKDNYCYPACPSEVCNNKKVEKNDSDQWSCERCEKSYPKPKYRYILSLNATDHTGQTWLNCFDEVGKLIMGTTADQLMELKDNDEKAMNALVHEATCQSWNFKCRAKLDNFQDQQRVRYQVSWARSRNFSEEASQVMELISSYV